MGKCECGRLKGNPCGPLRPNTINVTMPAYAAGVVMRLAGLPDRSLVMILSRLLLQQFQKAHVWISRQQIDLREIPTGASGMTPDG